MKFLNLIRELRLQGYTKTINRFQKQLKLFPCQIGQEVRESLPADKMTTKIKENKLPPREKSKPISFPIKANAPQTE